MTPKSLNVLKNLGSTPPLRVDLEIFGPHKPMVLSREKHKNDITKDKYINNRQNIFCVFCVLATVTRGSPFSCLRINKKNKKLNLNKISTQNK